MRKHKDQGFTIIEVVLVLAIAGLIFLMVFIALPALQRGQRDQARKNDATVVATAINTFKSSNRSSLSGMTNDKLRQYIDRLDQYDTENVVLAASNNVSMDGENGNNIVVRAGAKCPETAFAPGETTAKLASAAPRQAAILVLLENNGKQSQIFCTGV